MAFGFKLNAPRSLRGQLIGVVAALVVPLIALQLWSGYRESQRAVDAARDAALALAEARAVGVRQFLAQSETILKATSEQRSAGFVSGPACDQSMETLANLFTLAANVTTVDPDGNLVCSSVSPIPEGTSGTELEWLPALAEDPRFSVGVPFFGTDSGVWVLPMRAPVLDAQGRFAGVIVGSVPLLELADLLAGEGQDEGFLVTIVNEEEVVVARSHDIEEWAGELFLQETLAYEEVGPSRAIASGPDLEGIEHAWGLIELDNGWRVSVGVPSKTILGVARVTAARQVGMTLLILLEQRSARDDKDSGAGGIGRKASATV